MLELELDLLLEDGVLEVLHILGQDHIHSVLEMQQQLQFGMQHLLHLLAQLQVYFSEDFQPTLALAGSISVTTQLLVEAFSLSLECNLRYIQQTLLQEQLLLEVLESKHSLDTLLIHTQALETEQFGVLELHLAQALLQAH